VLSSNDERICPSVCLSVILVIHAKMVQPIKMPFALYDRVILDARFFCLALASGAGQAASLALVPSLNFNGLVPLIIFNCYCLLISPTVTDYRGYQ